MTAYADIASVKEDDRIQIIGRTIMEGSRSESGKSKVVGFVVEDDEKADRYINKLMSKFPCVNVISRGVGPVKGTVLVRVGVKP